MRKVCLVLFGIFLCIDGVNAALRTQNTATPTTQRQSTVRTKTETTQTRSVSSRSTVVNDVLRKATARQESKKIVTGRSAKKTTATRSATSLPSRLARATATVKTRTFGSNYNSCRDAYFTCMDQFCAIQNETYRRCVCSSKLKDIQKQEKLLSQTSDSLKDFEDLNIDVISKTSKEVKAMISATDGEKSIKKDTSDSANTLKNISSVLKTSKSNALSTQGQLDIAGDIKSIWSTTNLIGGADIANLTGESLFNAVHTQCAELVTESCASSDLKMVSSAYGMYIENDCALLENNLKNKKTNANAAIRDTRHKMQDARLENYNAHNSVNINDCIANVRKDITSNSVCGNDYIHCLDFSGKYLNIATGEPIYTPEFYQIENQLDLSGDVLTNNKNATFINMLNKKRNFAAKSLDLCRDNAEDVWNEFLRQAIVEIYQGQQERVKSVKEECLQVVNECYLKQSDQLKNFSEKEAKLHLNQTLVLSEEMCADKLNTCSNLYGDLNTLVATMTGITDTTIEQSCPELLNIFATNFCAVSANDSSHSNPYGCRSMAPGESMYAMQPICNQTLVNPFAQNNILVTHVTIREESGYTRSCALNGTKIYKSCKYGYYLYNNKKLGNDNKEVDCDENNDSNYCFRPNKATECRKCPAAAVCVGGTSQPEINTSSIYNICGEYYIESLYQQLVRYAVQNCTRESDMEKAPSESLLADVNSVMNDLRRQMVKELSKECTYQSGIWVDIPWVDKNTDGIHDENGDYLHTKFYLTTGANALWGYCRQ